MALKGNWTPLVNGVSEIRVEPINEMAEAVIALEEKAEESVNIDIDSEMSDGSSNPVENRAIKAYIDEQVGDISTALSALLARQEEIITGGVE